MKIRTIQPARVTPSLLADTYLLPWSRSGKSGTVRWMPGHDACAGSFVFDVCPVWCLFQGRPDIEWVVSVSMDGYANFNDWLKVAGRNAILREQMRLYDILWGTGEILKPDRFDCVTTRTPELSAICEYGAPTIDCELRHRPSRYHWRQRISCHVWQRWPLANVRLEFL